LEANSQSLYQCVTLFAPSYKSPVDDNIVHVTEKFHWFVIVRNRWFGI
jgi:hypothetical protein